ncbi:MAG: protein TolR [Rickettsiales bacterium]|nr:protein TolR [Rickettsiales bacterium]
MDNLIIAPRKRKRAMINNINVTPLVDVMLVLLVIFMITSPMLVAGINVDLPTANGQVMSESDEPISVSIDKFGNIYINNTRIKASKLTKKLKAITKANYNLRIFVRSDKAVSYGKVIKIMGLINKAGFSKVALVTNLDS